MATAPRRPAKKKSGSQKNSDGSRAGNTRRPLERIVRIHERINRGRYPNCSKIAADLETSRKTIQRDITFMRSDLTWREKVLGSKKSDRADQRTDHPDSP